MNTRTLLCLIIFTLAGIASTASAMDVGIIAPTDKKFRAEVYYEAFERDIEQEWGFGDGSYTGLQEEDRVVARFTFTPQRFWGLSLEIGGTDSDGSEDVAPMFGAGAHIVLLERGGFYTSAFGRATWITGVEYKNHYEYTNGDDFVRGTWTRDEAYLEYGMGLQLGYEWQPCASARVTTYAGAMTSFIDDTESEERESGTYFYSGSMTGAETFSMKDSSVDMEEAHVAQMFAGVEVALLPVDAGIRVEGRFYDRTSLSASVFWNF